MKANNQYVSYLDGFRGYAILFVIISHLGLAKMSIAFLGVTLFFYVSGLLITKLLIYEFEKKKDISLRDFYMRRLFRLYPALLFMLLVSSIVLITHHYSIILQDIFSGIFYFTNYYLVYFNPPVPDSGYLLVSRILWSLSVEEHFYILFPLMFLFTFPKKGKTFLYVLSTLLLVFLIVRIYSYLQAPDAATGFEITYYTTHCRGDSILFGSISAVLIYKHNTNWYIKLLQNYLAVLTGVVLIIFSLVYQQPFFQSTFKYTIQGIGFFLMIPAFSFLFKKGFVRKLVDNSLIIYIGKLSYSLYLFHWVALKIGNLNFTQHTLSWYFFIIVTTAALSLISYYFVEQPFIGLRKKFGSNAKPSPMAIPAP